MEPLRHASLAAWLGLLVGAAPLAAALVYLARPNEQRLALMRPLSLAGIFSAICNLLLAAVNALAYLARVGSLDDVGIRTAALSLGEAVVPGAIGFGCLTVAWICVALGMQRERP
jgi:hypothetical protein